MPTGIPRIIALLHPILALVSLVFLAWVATLGLRSRERRERHLRPVHARLAVYGYVVVLVNFAGGTLTTWYLRPDLALAGSAHFRVGLVIVALFSVTALLSRWLGANETVRVLHPILGLLALVLAWVQVFFGMPLLPL